MIRRMVFFQLRYFHAQLNSTIIRLRKLTSWITCTNIHSNHAKVPPKLYFPMSTTALRRPITAMLPLSL